MTDVIETFGNSQIQHGRNSDRAYLMSLSRGDIPKLIPYLDRLAQKRGYGKIFAKVPSDARAPFLDSGYRTEATIPGLYRATTGAALLGKHLSENRAVEKKPKLLQQVLQAAQEKADTPASAELPPGFTCRQALPADAGAMAELYREVFATYPFPIHDPEYIAETMASHVLYFGIWDGETLVALASAEMDKRGQNAEMTDFATLPDCRGGGFATHLLATMEEAIQRRGIVTAFTIARAYSFGMNITFARAGYTHSGTLTNNTNISGAIESMNVWYKTLSAEC